MAGEITPESTRACEMLLTAGIPVSNQSVLLKGVNDDYETMRDLLYWSGADLGQALLPVSV